MSKLVVKVLVTFLIYLFFLSARVLYLLYKYIRKRDKKNKFLVILRNDETLLDSFWLVPLILIPLLLNNIFRNNFYYIIIMCCLTAIVGGVVLVFALRKNNEILLTEDTLVKKRKLILAAFACVLAIAIFWWKYFVRFVDAFYVISAFTMILLLVFIMNANKAIKRGEKISSIPGFYGIVAYLFLSILLIIMNLIYA